MTKLYFPLRRSTLLLLCVAFGARAQPAGPEIIGRVVGEKGAGLTGGTVLVNGTPVGTSTTLDGKFTLQVPISTGTLVLSSVDRIAQTVSIDGCQQGENTFRENLRVLADVVGYGTQKKIGVTGAVASISAQDIKDLPVVSSTESLNGQVAGVQVRQTSETPGNALPARVRGEATAWLIFPPRGQSRPAQD